MKFSMYDEEFCINQNISLGANHISSIFIAYSTLPEAIEAMQDCLRVLAKIHKPDPEQTGCEASNRPHEPPPSDSSSDSPYEPDADGVTKWRRSMSPYLELDSFCLCIFVYSRNGYQLQ